MPRGGAAAPKQHTLTEEQLDQLRASVQSVLEAADEGRLLTAISLFKPTFLLLNAASAEGEQLRGALKVMAFNMEDMALKDDTMAKAKRLFVGNSDLVLL